jgi:hypothetical protein
MRGCVPSPDCIGWLQRLWPGCLALPHHAPCSHPQSVLVTRPLCGSCRPGTAGLVGPSPPAYQSPQGSRPGPAFLLLPPARMTLPPYIDCRCPQPNCFTSASCLGSSRELPLQSSYWVHGLVLPSLGSRSRILTHSRPPPLVVLKHSDALTPVPIYRPPPLHHTQWRTLLRPSLFPSSDIGRAIPRPDLRRRHTRARRARQSRHPRRRLVRRRSRSSCTRGGRVC